MRFSRQEYLDLMTFKYPQRQMFVELFGPLVGLEDEWRAQGATDDEINLTAFDWDYLEVVRCGGLTGLNGGYQPVILEETTEYRIERDGLGRTMKLPKGFATIALPLDFPVKDWDSWLKVKSWYMYSEDRIDWQAVEQAKAAQSRGALVVASIPGAYDTPRELLGDAVACACYYEQPDLMVDILQTISDTAFRVLEQISARLVIDQLSVHEDMAGKAGPLVGPRQVRMFIKPYYSRIWDLLSSRGTQIFDMDSDGNMMPVLDAFLECGLNSMHPMEPAAGMDVVEIRKKYRNKLAIRGGIDKHVLRSNKEAIRAELEYKLQPFMQQGGIAFGLDHRIPNGTPIENYRYYVNLGRELLKLPPLDGKNRGWRRMAF